MNWMSFSDGDGPGVSKVSNVLCHCLKLTYFVRGSITVQLNDCFGFRCFVMLKLSTYILVWLNPNYLNGRSVKHWYLPFTKWALSYNLVKYWPCLLKKDYNQKYLVFVYPNSPALYQVKWTFSFYAQQISPSNSIREFEFECKCRRKTGLIKNHLLWEQIQTVNAIT